LRFPAEATLESYAYAVIGALIVLSIFGLQALAPRLPVERWGWLGFIGAWFLMILAPSSSIVPIATEMAAERRIYLPLAAVVVLMLIGVETLRRSLDDPSGARSRSGLLCALAAVALFYLSVSGWLIHRWLELLRGEPFFIVEWMGRLLVAAGVASAAYQVIRA